MAKKILIIDDDKEDLELMKKILTKEKHEITCYDNSTKAFEHLKKSRFDLVLLDILMPDLSGYDLLKLLREKFNSSFKIVFVSIVPKGDVDLKGIDGFIQKPFSEKFFSVQINKILNFKKSIKATKKT